MRTYENNQPLLRYIKQDNLKDIKEELLNTIFLVGGDASEMEKAFAYAEQNSSFAFEEHKELPVPNTSDLESVYAREKMNMMKNFSRERYEKILHIHHQIYPPVTANEDIESGKSENINNQVVIGVAIGVAVVGLLYLIFKD